MNKEEINKLSVEYVLLKGLKSKDYYQLKRIKELENIISGTSDNTTSLQK